MYLEDDSAKSESTGTPVGVMVLRAQRTAHGVHLRVTSTRDVERTPQGVTTVYVEIERAVADVASWLETFAMPVQS